MNPRKLIALVILLGAALIPTLFYRSRPTLSPEEGKLSVVASFFPLYDFVRVVGGNTISPTLLFTQTPEASTLTAENIQTLRTARLIVKLGAGFEPALEDVLRSLDGKPATVDAINGLGTIGDPHVWLNPKKAETIVGTIRDALTHIDPVNAQGYRDRARTYINELQALDRETTTALVSLPNKRFIAFHNAFADFAKQYGLEQVGVIEENAGDGPTPTEVGELIKLVKSRGVKVLFSEPQFNPRVLSTIAGETGATILTLDPIESGNPSTDSYLSLSRKNLQTLKEALQ